jgi:AcrR family transcriptional regulator
MDPDVDRAIAAAAFELLSERGFAGMSMEAVAARAGVGKPAIYRRYPDKAALVAAVIAAQLPVLEIPDRGDSRAELWGAVRGGFPEDGDAYLGLIGGLAAEHERHPELIAAFREHVLGPRRATVSNAVKRAQARGDVRPDIDPTAAVDLIAGPLLARLFAGAETGPRWRKRAFDLWWDLVKRKD